MPCIHWLFRCRDVLFNARLQIASNSRRLACWRCGGPSESDHNPAKSGQFTSCFYAKLYSLTKGHSGRSSLLTHYRVLRACAYATQTADRIRRRAVPRTGREVATPPVQGWVCRPKEDWFATLAAYGFAAWERAAAPMGIRQPRCPALRCLAFFAVQFGTRPGLNLNSEVGRRLDRSAGFSTCCIADFQVGWPLENVAAPNCPSPAGWETRDAADWEVCATSSPLEFGMKAIFLLEF